MVRGVQMTPVTMARMYMTAWWGAWAANDRMDALIECHKTLRMYADMLMDGGMPISMFTELFPSWAVSEAFILVQALYAELALIRRNIEMAHGEMALCDIECTELSERLGLPHEEIERLAIEGQ
jgi:hypothetical protein